jgi:hypothetical protein
MPLRHIRLAGLVLPMVLGACASTNGEYPSLAIRDAERVSGSAQPVEVAPRPPAPPLDSTIAGRIASAVAQARKANGSFAAASSRTERTVSAARGTRSPGDAWIAAQVALADLVSLRSEAVIAQADLDLLYTSERLSDPERITPTAQALMDARSQVAGWVADQDRTIARLIGQLAN